MTTANSFPGAIFMLKGYKRVSGIQTSLQSINRNFILMKNRQLNAMTIGVIGMGYVGLPLAISLSVHFKVVGYDVNEDRIDELKSGFDRTNEINLKKQRKQIDKPCLPLTLAILKIAISTSLLYQHL